MMPQPGQARLNSSCERQRDGCLSSQAGEIRKNMQGRSKQPPNFPALMTLCIATSYFLSADEWHAVGVCEAAVSDKNQIDQPPDATATTRQ